MQRTRVLACPDGDPCVHSWQGELQVPPRAPAKTCCGGVRKSTYSGWISLLPMSPLPRLPTRGPPKTGRRTVEPTPSSDALQRMQHTNNRRTLRRSMPTLPGSTQFAVPQAALRPWTIRSTIASAGNGSLKRTTCSTSPGYAGRPVSSSKLLMVLQTLFAHALPRAKCVTQLSPSTG